MEHSFDVAIAEAYGVNEAILLKHLHFWIQKNAANGRHFHDGAYWTYNSKKAFSELFPYLTERQIGYALQRLIDAGVVATGNYNSDQRDRTLWYSITQKGYFVLQNCQMEMTKLSNADDGVVRALPDNKHTDTLSLDKPKKERKRFTPPTVEEVEAYCRERGNTVDAETFVDFYSGKDWMVGKNKMADWKATVRTWERRQASERTQRETPPQDAFMAFLDEELTKGGRKG